MKRSIFCWIHIVFGIPIIGYFIVRLKNFRTTPPLFGMWPFLSLSLRDFGCGKAMSFDDLFRKDQPKTTQQLKRKLYERR
jgi:hypothetical protein